MIVPIALEVYRIPKATRPCQSVDNEPRLCRDDRFSHLPSRMFVRATAQYVSTDREPGLYVFATAATSGTVSGQVLLSYKLNWQSVMFVGYGDDRMLSTQDRFEKVDRQFFVKLSYAFQR
jgi:hypothetical protein